MAVQTVTQTVTERTAKHKKKEKIDERSADLNTINSKDNSEVDNVVLAYGHLPPLFLVFVVIMCSGTLFVLGLRDFFSTGRPISMLGSMDELYLQFTKSSMFYDDANGWKSTQGGFSSIQKFTTDSNNMGGLFVRKMGGAAMAGVHLQKLLPLLFHPNGAQWNKKHFRPLLNVALLGNLALIMFYTSYLDELVQAGANPYPQFILSLLSLESFVIFFCLLKSNKIAASTKNNNSTTIAHKLPPGKTPDSVTCRIATRTVSIVSSFVTLISIRDLFFPGYIFKFLPRDDIYLEWTNALLHSPPPDSPEYLENGADGMESLLYIGDKFLSQSMALNILILCLYKFAAAYVIKVGNDGTTGKMQCQMIWKSQTLSNAALVFMMRLFTPAAATASLDLRWHLMALGYETFIFALYGFF